MSVNFKRVAQGSWWVLVTIALAPFAMLALALGRAFEWLGEAMQSLFDWMCEFKHQVAPQLPPTPEQESKIEADADADL